MSHWLHYLYRLFVTIGAILLTGCVQLSEPVKPDVAERFSVSGSHTHSNHWWKEFNDPQLNMLIAEALSDSFTLKSAQARMHRAAAQAGIDTAKRYPELNATLDNDYQKGRFTENQEIRSFTDVEAGLKARWEFDIWGKNRYEAEAAEYNLLASEERLQAAGLALASNIARIWFELIEQEQSLVILTQQLDNTRTIAEITLHRYRTGQGSISALWRQEQMIESLQASHQKAIKKQQIFEKQLNVLLGRTSSTPINWQYTSLPYFPPLPDAGVPAQLLERRPDVRALWYQYQSKLHQIASAQAAQLPNIVLTAKSSSNAESWSDIFELWRLDLGAQLSVPIFQGGRLQSLEKRAKADADEAFYDYTQGVLAAIKEVETGILEELSQQEQLDSLKRQVQQARHILEVELVRYSQGTQGYLDVLNAQEKLFTLQQRKLTNHRQLYSRRIAVYQATGGGLLTISSLGDLMLNDREPS